MKFLFSMAILVFTVGTTLALPNTPPIYPWHMIDIWWVNSKDFDDFESVKVDFEVIGPIDSRVDLYISPLGTGFINDMQFYGGVQTNVYARQDKNVPKQINIGSGGIFSRWSSNGKPISVKYASGDNNTFYDSAGYEGEFVGVRRKFQWGEGKYSFAIRRENKISEESAYWFGAYLFDYQNSTEYYYGSLKFEGDTFHLSKNIAAFYEVYGTSTKIPNIAVIFDDPIINEKKMQPSEVIVNYPDNGYRNEKRPRFSIAERGKGKIVVATVPNGILDGVQSERF